MPVGEVYDYIETFHNAARRHSTLGYLSPAQFGATHPTNLRRSRPNHPCPSKRAHAMSVPIASSRPATRYQGSVFHARRPEGSQSDERVTGRWETAFTGDGPRRQVDGDDLVEHVCLDVGSGWAVHSGLGAVIVGRGLEGRIRRVRSLSGLRSTPRFVPVLPPWPISVLKTSCPTASG
jgi:hypothetical protein